MPQHGRSSENRLANLTTGLASPTSKLLLLWDLLQGSGPPNLRDQVSPASTRTQYCPRNPLSLAAPHCRTVHRLKSFLPSTVTLFISLPSSAVSCSSESSFKHAIDLHFVEDKFSEFRTFVTLLWNMLPREVQTSSSMLVFKRNVLSLLDSPSSGKNLLQICFGNTTI